MRKVFREREQQTIGGSEHGGTEEEHSRPDHYKKKTFKKVKKRIEQNKIKLSSGWRVKQKKNIFFF